MLQRGPSNWTSAALALSENRQRPAVVDKPDLGNKSCSDESANIRRAA